LVIRLAASACVGVATWVLAAQLVNLLTRRRQTLQERLKVAVSTEDVPSLPDVPGSASVVKKRRITLPVIPNLRQLVGKQYLDKVRLNLMKAGLPIKPEELMTITAISALLGAGLGLLLKKPWLAILLGLSAIPMQNVWVTLVKRRRAARLEGQLIDAFTLIANSLRAGHSFMQALEVVSRDLGPPLAPELARVIREGRMGLSVDDAFAGLVHRFDSKDLELAVTGVLIQRQVGGNLAQVLTNIVTTIDKRIKSRGKVRALTAQGRMSALVVSVLPFGLAAFMFAFYPEFAMVMLQEPLGLAMLIGAGVLMVIGIFAIRKVVNVDV
jgi:tight adherence protein B